MIKKFLDVQFAGYSELKWPDLKPGAVSEVDATFVFKSLPIALEHTRIIRFPEEIPSNNQFLEIRKRLTDGCDIVPTGRFTVFLSCRNLGGRRRRTELIDEILKELPNLLHRASVERSIENKPILNIPVWAYWSYPND